MTGRAVQTDGVGNKTDKHLNLTRTLADAWHLNHGQVAAVKRELHGGPARPAGLFFLKDAFGAYLHESCQGLTNNPKFAWRGVAAQADRVKSKFDVAKTLTESVA